MGQAPFRLPKKINGLLLFPNLDKKPGGRRDAAPEDVLKKLAGLQRTGNGRRESTSFCIIDARSVQNANAAEEKGCDAGKKVSGIKWHIAVDTEGLPHAIHVTTANISDKAGSLEMISLRESSLSHVVSVLCDGGYAGKPFADCVEETIGPDVEIVRRSERRQFIGIPRRWIVERSFRWSDKCRRFWKNCERKLHTSCQMVVSAFIALLLKRF